VVTMEKWIENTLNRMVIDMKDYQSDMKTYDAEIVVKDLFKSYYKERVKNDEKQLKLSNSCVRNLLEKSYKLSDYYSNKLIFCLTAELIMKKRPGVKINFKGLLKNFIYKNHDLAFQKQLNRFIITNEDDA